MKWYLPTFYGDIRLMSLDKNRTRVQLVSLTGNEKKAVTVLRKTALAPPWKRAAWCQLEDFPLVETLRGEHIIELDAPLGRVQKLLAKELKPTRTLMNVVRFGDDKMEEVIEWREEEKPPKKEAKAGTTVAQPTLGCPVPDFAAANVRATDVLRAFLTEQQVGDFDRQQRFVTVGADTGHRYMLTSRLARDELGHFGSRSVYDLDERRSYCVHDYMVPASEELLALHLFLSLPGRESFVRAIPDRSIH